MKKEQKHITEEQIMSYLLGEASMEQNSQMEFWLAHSEANKQYFEEMKANADPVIKGSMEQLAYGTPMPTIPEMRAVWDSIRPHLEAVLNGSETPEQAAAGMQKDAKEKIAKMHGE